MINGMRKVIQYRIAYYGPDRHLIWCGCKHGFLPAGLHLYHKTYDTIEDAMASYRAVRKAHSGWHDDIYIDSYITYV